MSWPWKFVDLDDAEKALRREVINRYAGFAQLSAFAPLFAVLVYRLAQWAAHKVHYAGGTTRRAGYSAVPESPVRKRQRQSPLGLWTARYRRLVWWLGDDVVVVGGWHLGRRDEWVFGLGWGAWMAVLCLVGTGDDYLHLTKRVGAIAISQLPLQYMLALKNLNPIAFVLGSSHEEINRFHRTLGRIVYYLLLCHAILYLNFFIEKGLLMQKLTGSRVVQTGIFGILSMDALALTAFRGIRNYSYRLFFITHLSVSLVLPPLIWFHAHSARIFLVEALAIFLLDIIARKLDTTTTTSATITAVPQTDLLQITAPIPPSKLPRFTARPGAHLLLQLQGASLIHEFLFNPFTIAAVDAEQNTAALVLRRQRGPTTTTLSQLVQDDNVVATLALEGPYGSPAVLAAAARYDRVLLVAGGIGATYTLPLYRAVLEKHKNRAVRFVWAVRSVEELVWAGELEQEAGVDVFVTGQGDDDDGVVVREEEEGVELKERGRQRRRGRPDLRVVVEEVFRLGQEESVAVVFCGPAAMGRELRTAVAGWVSRGRRVFWHGESFEW